ncbi:MAG: hypothetical protein ACP5VS_18520 [Desulfomonilaceae bacterium]
MANNFQQFLGSTPGIIVELIDGEKSPFKVRSEDGFEFWISAEDFKNYYKEQGAPTPKKWKLFVTDEGKSLVETQVAGEALNLVNSLKVVFQNFMKTRIFLKDCYSNIMGTGTDIAKIKDLMRRSAKFPEAISDNNALDVIALSPKARQLLSGNEFAFLDWPLNHSIEITPRDGISQELKQNAQKNPSRSMSQRMKNVELSVQGDILTISVNLSREFGPSKSGKTIIVASTEGNKTIPGRNEKVGLNVYKELGAGNKTGNQKSFKNMEMQVDDDNMIVTVNLSKELGPSKSGKTIIIGSTGGNQLVYGRSEKVGINVYKAV